MLRKEKNYDFRKRVCEMHRAINAADIRPAREDEYLIKDGVAICAPDGDEVIATAVEDMKNYLKTSFGINASSGKKAPGIEICLDSSVGGYAARKTVVTASGVKIIAADGRGAAQALYALEDRMNTACAPVLKKGEVFAEPAFTPRMIHSGLGIDLFPDEFLSACAHHGFDAVLVFVRDLDKGGMGTEYDFNDLVRRAAKYGMDVYAYSCIKNFTDPQEEGSKKIFADIYGGLFKKVPGLKGMVFVGESIEFKSRDPHVDPTPHDLPPKDGIPSAKPHPGWYPCYDYVEWLCLVRDSIRAEKPDADIVFWTYNWGKRSEEERMALLNKLPTDVTLLSTFETGADIDLGTGKGAVSDYSISFAGPAPRCASEAALCRRRGMKFYVQANTCGRTWDFGVIPYEPFPGQWNRRNEQLLKMQKEYGLSGIMESHHNGFIPSFVSMLAKYTFIPGSAPFKDRLADAARAFSKTEWETVLSAFEDLDASITFYVSSNENQYGPYRIGPAYPFCLKRELKLPNTKEMMSGNGIYKTFNVNTDSTNVDPYSVRVRGEMRMLEKSLRYTESALKKLRGIQEKNDDLLRFINLVDYIVHCHRTAINFHKFYIYRVKLLAAANMDEVHRLADRIERIAKKEIANAKSTIPLVRRDSALGYEPSMEYQCDEAGIRWKLKQMEYMLTAELITYKKK